VTTPAHKKGLGVKEELMQRAYWLAERAGPH